jgi:cephalosporin hydroxylase
MNNEISVALIGSVTSILASIITLIGVFVKLKQANNEIVHRLDISQAVTDTKIDELTREVREHNNFAQRIPVVESKLEKAEQTMAELKKYHMK